MLALNDIVHPNGAIGMNAVIGELSFERITVENRDYH
jgi:hypothetical protein